MQPWFDMNRVIGDLFKEVVSAISEGKGTSISFEDIYAHIEERDLIGFLKENEIVDYWPFDKDDEDKEFMEKLYDALKQTTTRPAKHVLATPESMPEIQSKVMGYDPGYVKGREREMFKLKQGDSGLYLLLNLLFSTFCSWK